MNRINKILNIIDLINEWTGKAASFLLVILMSLVVYDVGLRYLLKRPTDWAMELNGFILLGLTFLGGGYVLLHGGHVEVDIIHKRFSPRMRALIDTFTYLVLLCTCIVLVWFGGKTTYDSLIHGYRTSSTWAPLLWSSQIIVPLGGVLIGLQGLAKLIRDWVMVIKNVKLESKLTSGDRSG